MQTLVLDHTYRPVKRVPWEKAFTWVFAGRAQVIAEYKRFVRSAAKAWPVPSIIRFLSGAKKKSRRKLQVRFSRRNVYLRDQGQCQYCALKVRFDDFTYDHVTPISRGGKTQWENIVVSCLSCNQKKGGRTPQEASMRLLNLPIKPKKVPHGQPPIAWQEGMPESWKDWLSSMGYWSTSLDS